MSVEKDPLLQVRDLVAGYGKNQVLHKISMWVGESEIVALLGHNGAGKTTTLKAIVGALKPWDGRVLYEGREITGRSPVANTRAGIVQIPQESSICPELSVQENLSLGGFTVPPGEEAAGRLESVHALFPALGERRKQPAGTLSGGEQRMLSLGMAMMVRPRLLLLDEPSLGLSPQLVHRTIDAIGGLSESFGMAVLLVEQNVKQALRIARRVYVLKAGRLVVEEDRDRFSSRHQWWDLF